MHHIGHLGTSLLLLPMSLALLVALAWSGRRRDAIAFGAALAVCLAVTLAAKLGFRTCSFDRSAVESPSGHASLSAMFYGCCALLLAGGRPLAQRLTIYLGTAALVLCIGVSRVIVEAHSWPEVALGTAIGLLPLLVFALARGAPTRVAIPSRTMLAAVPVIVFAAAVILLVARQWTPEPLIERAAIRLDAFLQVCS